MAALDHERPGDQQVGELRPLLDEVELGHPFGFALELIGGNANQLAQHIAGVVERKRLIEVTGKNVASQSVVTHAHWIRAPGQ